MFLIKAPIFECYVVWSTRTKLQKRLDSILNMITILGSSIDIIGGIE